jgi:ADP-heptose:LPS heptosyltransferase
VTPKWVGDTVMALPALEAIGRSGHEVVALAKRSLHPLLRLSPWVRELVERDADFFDIENRVPCNLATTTQISGVCGWQ